jgi:hypothetical protein
MCLPSLPPGAPNCLQEPGAQEQAQRGDTGQPLGVPSVCALGAPEGRGGNTLQQGRSEQAQACLSLSLALTFSFYLCIHGADPLLRVETLSFLSL